ncbi:hypothetical protein CASFOL_000001 [Castilleja foliolosa]|uniref:non-specific serine/threonine protein kinase n=1 Tax=Castilleja foliolosa TaxID=1961234 RepID=A0ABD3EMF5_9LAMI
MQPLHLQFSSSYIFFILLTVITYKLAAAAGDQISINCGSSAATSKALSGREWVGDDDDVTNPKFSIKGSSSSSSSIGISVTVDPVPYNTARVSRSRFTYTFHRLGRPGQKLIRLYFNPANSYDNDFFTVEAGPFTLLSNFSPSITARALSLATVAKEFCLITTHENQSLDIIFTPLLSSYAFINGLEIISLPSTLSYCHINNGVQVVGQKSIVHIDHTTALETIHRLNVKWDSVPLSTDDIRGMFGMWATIIKQNVNNFYNITWKVSVDVGFRYLVRLHFSETGIKMIGHKDFVLLVNHMFATTGADILGGEDERNSLWYKNYMVMVQGHKREGKRDFFISLCSKYEFYEGHIPLEGFEIFKLSNHDNSLASPNLLSPPTTTSTDSSTSNSIIVSVLGRRNAIATFFIATFCMVNIIVHVLRQYWESRLTEEDLKPSNRAKRLCRYFSLAEIESATVNFNDAYVIGKGGFGKVYKGLIDNEQQIVALKRLKSDSNQGKREFWTEIEILSELRHVNLVSLIGYCNKKSEMIIVYEYMPRGTLADHLYKLARKNNNNNYGIVDNNNNASSFLSWKQRLNICIGAGRGLDYLHTGHGIIHRDVKTTNILLDENFVAKVSDFGLAKTENGSELQSLKGTFGYFDPDYYKTRILTTKSDVYSFGVVLLEVLCGRPAVEPLADEDKRSLTMWAQDKINKREVEHIVDPSLRGKISPDSLKAFVRVVERCLRNEPKKRPAMANVVIRLQFSLKQQENAESLEPSSEITSVADFFPSNNGNANSSPPNANDDDVATSAQQDKEKSVLPDQITAYVSNEQTYSGMINAGKRDGRKRVMRKLSRLLPWNAFSSIAKPSKKKEFKLFSVSAPMASRNNKSMVLGVNTTFAEKTIGTGMYSFKKVRSDRTDLINQSLAMSPPIPRTEGEILQSSNLKSFTFNDLKLATRNFRPDSILGEGGFGSVFKGWVDKNTLAASGHVSDMVVAIKRLNQDGFQGHKEWLAEINYLGQIIHPNLVKLIGYCVQDEHRLLVYEFMPKGSMENYLFRRVSYAEPLSWSLRMKIALGAARGLAFLHSDEVKVIYRDFKTSNILLDSNYIPKLSDFGMARDGPTGDKSHVSTRVMGTHGYAAPEYISTGHLTERSDVYSFGVVLLEILTGKRVIEHNLVEWAKPFLTNKRRIFQVLDTRLEGQYSVGQAMKAANLARQCLSTDARSRPTMDEAVTALEHLQDSNDPSKNNRKGNRVNWLA